MSRGDKQTVMNEDPTRMKMLELAISRMGLGSLLGQSFGGKRDMYVSCGWDKLLTIQQYQDLYDRGDIAQTIVNAYPDGTWEADPVVREDKPGSTRNIPSAQTEFETAWEELTDELELNTFFQRVDRQAGIGQFGVLLVGLDDGLDPSQPVVKKAGARITYLRPLSEAGISISQWDNDIRSPRYGKPVLYSIQLQQLNTQNATVGEPSTSIIAHYTRVLHVADGLQSSLVLGTPRLQGVWNRLFDAHKVLGCSAEMFWQGAFKGFSLNVNPEAELTDSDTLKAKMQDYIHGIQRYLITQGIDVKELGGAVADPQSHINIQLQFISAFTGIPMRILLGSERGELASSQDERGWHQKLKRRRSKYATPTIIKPFARLCCNAGVLPEPRKGTFWVEWPEANEMDAAAMASVGLQRTQAMGAYISGGVSGLVSPTDFLVRVLGFERWEAEEMIAGADGNAINLIAEEQTPEEPVVEGETPPPEVPSKEEEPPTEEQGTPKPPRKRGK